MVGLKRTASDASCDGDCHAEESSPRKQLRPAPEDWCLRCEGPAKDLCIDDHHLVVDIHMSEANVLSRFADIRDLVVITQGRLDVMLDARLRHGPVLEAAVEGVDKEGWRVPGGDISITMAAVPANLSAEEKDAVCAALSGVRLDYKMKGTECAVGFGDVAVDALQTVLPRLPACAEGQTVQRGAVLLHGSQLLVFFRKTRLDGRGDAAKLFGYLSKSSQDALEGRAEDRLTQVVPVGFSGVKFAK